MKVTQLISALAVGLGLILGGCGDDVGGGSLSDEALSTNFCDFDYGCFPEDWIDHAECVDGARSDLDFSSEISDLCYDAMRGLLECLVGLESCGELEDYWEERDGSSPYPCQDENELYFSRCSSE